MPNRRATCTRAMALVLGVALLISRASGAPPREVAAATCGPTGRTSDARKLPALKLALGAWQSLAAWPAPVQFAWSPDGNYLTVSADRTVELLTFDANSPSATERAVMAPPAEELGQLGRVVWAQIVGVASSKKAVWYFRPTTGQNGKPGIVQDGYWKVGNDFTTTILDFDWDRLSRFLVMLSAEGWISIVKYGENTGRFYLEIEEQGMRHIRWCGAAHELLAGLSDNVLRLWRVHDESGPADGLLSANKRFGPLEISPDGLMLAVGDGENVRIWDLRRNELAELRGHEKPVTALCWDADGRTLASGDEGGAVRVWDAFGAEMLCEAATLPAAISCLAFRPNAARTPATHLGAGDRAGKLCVAEITR